MGILRYSVWIDATPDALWSAWTDIDLIPSWQTGHPRVASVTGDGGVADAPSHHVAKTQALLGLRFDLDARLTPESGGTRLALEARTAWPTGLGWLGRGVEAFVLSPHEAERELANLKTIVESGEWTTVDPRQAMP